MMSLIGHYQIRNMKIKIEKSGINGEGIGYLNQKPIFVFSALPSEEVEIEIIEDKGRYANASLMRVYKASTHRIQAPCHVQKECGACALMICDYKHQLELKRENLIQSLLKYSGNFDFKILRPIIENPSPFGYRNSLKMPFQKNKRLENGLYKSGTNHFVPIDTCLIHEPILEVQRHEILAILNKYHCDAFKAPNNQGLRSLVMRHFNGFTQVTLVSGKDEISDQIFKEISEIKGISSLYHSIHFSKKSSELFGKDIIHKAGFKTLRFDYANLVLELLPNAFFQLNPLQSEKLFNTVLSFIESNDEVLDVYCGVGTLSLMMAKKAKSVIAIELSKDSIFAANRNAKLNHLKNVSFIAADAATELKKINLNDKVVILDPPRSGLDEAMVELLVKYPPKTIIYISCNPSTLAKNLKELKKLYRIESIQPFDFFSQTPLLESVVVLRRLKSK